MKHFRWVVLLILISSLALSADDLFDFKPVVEGVYAAIAKPQFRNNTNATIILLDDAVMVVDTQSKPSAARAVIAEIKRLTDKPVRYVVLSDFHGDHFQGAEAYPETWPGVQIISSETTRENIQRLGIPRMEREAAALPGQIDKLKADLEKATDAKEKTRFQESIYEAESYQAELKVMKVALPTLTFDRSLTLHSKSRTVEILWLGRAHTDGDIFVYLPKEKVITTGGALHSMVPDMHDSYPYEWIGTLDALEKLDLNYVVGGHGDVLRGKETIEIWKEYFRNLLTETTQAYSQGATLDETRKRVAPVLLREYEGKFPETFPRILMLNIEKAYQVAAGWTE
jgi:glyoxylase-like metal-dependent hydrolase (beta-lactamase superfamily II)